MPITNYWKLITPLIISPHRLFLTTSNSYIVSRPFFSGPLHRSGDWFCVQTTKAAAAFQTETEQRSRWTVSQNYYLLKKIKKKSCSTFLRKGGGGSQNHDDLLVAINSSPPRVARWDFETIYAHSLSKHSFVFPFCFIIFLFVNIYANYFHFLHHLQLISLFADEHHRRLTAKCQQFHQRLLTTHRLPILVESTVTQNYFKKHHS